jgi:SAM-dependent methyltransferase
MFRLPLPLVVTEPTVEWYGGEPPAFEETPMSRPDWVPAGVDLDRPNVARMYDYYLGGSHNFRVDRELADQAIAAFPSLPRICQANRAFLHRAVRYCLGAGVRQFLDIGSGIPTVGNVHEIAQRLDSSARVVYVDTDAIAIAHARALLASNDRAAAIRRDGRQPDAILDDPEVRRVLDFDQPVAVLLVAVLHFVSDEDRPEALVARLVERVAAGSHVVISHGMAEGEHDPDGPVLSLYRRTPTPLRPRTRQAIEGLFAGLDLVDPGVVLVPQWRPDTLRDADDNDEWCMNLAGVARKAR